MPASNVSQLTVPPLGAPFGTVVYKGETLKVELSDAWYMFFRRLYGSVKNLETLSNIA